MPQLVGLRSRTAGCTERRLFRKATIEVSQKTIVSYKLFDWDRTGDDESLGRATVEISNVVERGVLDTWLTLEEAKHGQLHVRLTWYKLTTDRSYLQAALEETQLLRVTSMSTALLTLFVDSAKNLPHPRLTSSPDPYLIVSVGKHVEQTPVQLRVDSPVWEQGYSFLVGNPDNDTLQVKIMDHKTGSELGRYTYILGTLLAKKNMEIVAQPFQLQKSGPESKIIMSAALKILKRAESVEDDTISVSSEQTNAGSFSRSTSIKTPPIQLETKDNVQSLLSAENETPAIERNVSKSTLHSMPLTPQSVRSERFSTSDSMSVSGEHNLGRIQLTVQYSLQRQKLSVTVHKILNIPLTDPTNIPDPYVKLYLLPGRSKESKRKTTVIKDNCNPSYEQTFEYVISSAELFSTELEITVCTQKGFLYGGSPIIGMLKIALAEPEISTTGLSSWFDLHPESKMHNE